MYVCMLQSIHITTYLMCICVVCLPPCALTAITAAYALYSKHIHKPQISLALRFCILALPVLALLFLAICFCWRIQTQKNKLVGFSFSLLASVLNISTAHAAVCIIRTVWDKMHTLKNILMILILHLFPYCMNHVSYVAILIISVWLLLFCTLS